MTQIMIFPSTLSSTDLPLSAGAAHMGDLGCGQRLMMTPTNYSPEDSLSEDLPSDDELPKLKLYITDELSSSRSPSP